MGRQLAEEEGGWSHWKLCEKTSGKKNGRRSSLKAFLHTVAISPLFFSFWFSEKELETAPSSWHIRDTMPEPVSPLLG